MGAHRENRTNEPMLVEISLAVIITEGTKLACEQKVSGMEDDRAVGSR